MRLARCREYALAKRAISIIRAGHADLANRPSPLAVWPFTHRAGKVSLGATRAGRISREERPLWGRLQSPRRRILENDPDTIIE